MRRGGRQGGGGGDVAKRGIGEGRCAARSSRRVGVPGPELASEPNKLSIVDIHLMFLEVWLLSLLVLLVLLLPLMLCLMLPHIQQT